MTNYPEKIYDLLESKNFQDLNEQDRQFILQHMTEAEYRLMQAVWTNAQTEERNGSTESAEAWDALQAEFNKEHRTAAVPFWERSIPVYKAASAVLIPVLATILYYEQFRTQKPGEEIVTIADTIYVKGSTDTVFIKEKQKPEIRTTIIRVPQPEEDVRRASVPLSKDSTYLELTSNLRSSRS